MSGYTSGGLGRFAGVAGLALVLACSAHAATRPGVIRVDVDATQAPQRILHTHLAMPVEPGPLTLLFPEWIPGEHMPDGPINNIAGLKFTAARKVLPWRRDLLDMFSFHLTVPAGVTSLDVKFDFLISGVGSGYSSGASSTAYLNDLSWNQVILYPRGFAERSDLPRQPQVARRMEVRHGAPRRKTKRRYHQL